MPDGYTEEDVSMVARILYDHVPEEPVVVPARAVVRALSAAGRLFPGGATAGEHAYLSTGCLHGEHAYCQSMTGLQGNKRPGQCKFCDAYCVCECHRLSAAEPAEVPKP